MPYQIEVTDTFGGEANYCWVRRYTIDDVPAAKPGDDARQDAKRTRAFLIRKAKSLAGYTGIRGATSDYGDVIEWRPRGICHVMFITWMDNTP
jgi:hypothetical protein